MAGARNIGRAAAQFASGNAAAFGTRGGARSGASAATTTAPAKFILDGRIAPPYGSAVSPLGNDGGCAQSKTGSGAWQFVHVTDSAAGNIVLASACYHAPSGLIFSFGNWDMIDASSSRVLDTATDHYTALPDLPAFGGGHATYAAVYNNDAFIFSGGKFISGGYNFDSMIMRYPINPGALSQSYIDTGADVAYAAFNLFGAVDSQNPQYAYFGGGASLATTPPGNDGTVRSDWFRYDMSTPGTNPITRASLPVPLAMAACVDIGSEILVIGGCTINTPSTCGTNAIYAYNKAGNSWSTRGTYPVNVASARAAYFSGNSTIYCAGGWDATGFNITDDPPHATSAVYQSTDAGVTWTLHSNLVDIFYPPDGTNKGAKASGSSILVVK